MSRMVHRESEPETGTTTRPTASGAGAQTAMGCGSTRAAASTRRTKDSVGFQGILFYLGDKRGTPILRNIQIPVK